MNDAELAIVSLSDRRGAEELVRALVAAGLEVLATSGTERYLRSLGLPVRGMESLTGFPEILGGRVKTLHPLVHGGILARENVPEDLEALRRLGGRLVRLVAVTLYPFAEGEGLPEAERLELVDIGGVALLRAAAKSFEHVYVLSQPEQYPLAIAALASGRFDRQLARQLAAEAFFHTAAYDLAIATWLQNQTEEPPLRLGGVLEKVTDLRYGENPHSPAAWYRPLGRACHLSVLHPGRDGVSANNLADAEAAGRILCALLQGAELPLAAVIVKHGMPSSAALGTEPRQTLEAALDGDREAAFGGVLALSVPPDEAARRLLNEWFFEALVLPEGSLTPAEAARLAERPRLRVFAYRPYAGWKVRVLAGGVVLEAEDLPDVLPPDCQDWPTDLQRDAFLAWRVVAHARSNAVVLAKDGRTVGIGQGQVSRVRAVAEAVRLAGEAAEGAVLASDGFFPFPDAVAIAREAGIRAMIAPSGSRNDALVAEAARKAGISFVFAARRHFRHG